MLAYPPTRRVVLWTTPAYALVYLWAIGDLSFHVWRTVAGVTWVREPFEVLWRQRSLFYFEGIAIVELPLATLLFSPLNVLIAVALGVLVGLNLGLSNLGLKKPQTCGGRPAPGLLASVPALLAGTACSAPIVLVLLGLQASSALLALFSALVPIALVLLGAALVFNIRRTDTGALSGLARRP